MSAEKSTEKYELIHSTAGFWICVGEGIVCTGPKPEIAHDRWDDAYQKRVNAEAVCLSTGL